jgi:hypothetical protein
MSIQRSSEASFVWHGCSISCSSQQSVVLLGVPVSPGVTHLDLPLWLNSLLVFFQGWVRMLRCLLLDDITVVFC